MLVGTDKFGNKYYENNDELPRMSTTHLFLCLHADTDRHTSSHKMGGLLPPRF